EDDDVDAVRVLADVLVDPVELDGELFGREADGPEHAEPTRLADSGDHVAAVGESEDRELDAELVAEGRSHGVILPQNWNAFHNEGSPTTRPPPSTTCWPPSASSTAASVTSTTSRCSRATSGPRRSSGWRSTPTSGPT